MDFGGDINVVDNAPPSISATEWWEEAGAAQISSSLQYTMKAFVATLATLGAVSGQAHPGPAHVGIGNLAGGAHPNPAHTTPGQPYVSAHPGPAHPCPAFVPCPAGRKRREAANLFSLNADYGPQVAQMTSKFAQGQFGNGPANLAAPIVPPAPARPAYPQAAAPTRATYAPSAVASARARAAYAPAPAPARAAYVPAAAAPARAAYAPAAAPLQAPAPVSNSYKLNTPIGPDTHGQQITFAPSQAAPARAAPARPYVQPARARPAPARATYVQAQAPARANYAIASTAARAAQQRPAYVPAPAPQRAAPRRVPAQAPRRVPAQAPRRAPAQAPRRAPQQPRAPPRFANYKPAPTPSRAPAPVREQGAYPEPKPEPVTRKPVGQRYPEAEPYIHDPSGDDGEPYVHQTWGKKAYLARKQQELEAQRLEAEAAQQAPLEYENEIEQPRGGQNYADYY